MPCGKLTKTPRLFNINTMRKLPIGLILAAGIFINVMSTVGGRSVILSGLADFTFTVFSFLALIALFNDINLGQSSGIRKITGKINKILAEEEIYFGFRPAKFFEKIKARFVGEIAAETPAAMPDITPQSIKTESSPEDLIEIQKSKTEEQKDAAAEKNKRKSLLPGFYIALFAGLALWRLSRIFTVVPLSYTEQYNYSIVNALLLLFLYCITVIYLKMRKDQDKRPGDKASAGMLTLFSWVLLANAALIAATAVLDINILFVLQWLYYAATVYLLAALALNVLLSVFKNDILNFEYTIIPKTLKAAPQDNSFLDSEEVKANFSLKSLYTFKYALKILPAVFLSLGLILFLSTTVFVVQPYQQAAVFRLGRLDRSSIVGEGVHFKLPWPIDTVAVHDVHRINSLTIGYESDERTNFLWADSHDSGGFLLLLGNGNEAVAVNIRITYKISDLYSFIKTSSNPEAELTAEAYRALMNRTVNTTLDAFLSVDRSLLSASILEELSSFSEAKGLGLSVVQVIVENIHPPFEVADFYQRVATASIEKNTIVTNARAAAESMLIHAERQSITARDNALAEQQTRVSAAQKEMAVYYEAMQAYRINPRSFRLARYLNAFETAVGGNKVFVFSPGTEDSIPRSVTGLAGTGMIFPWRNYNE